MKEYIKYIQVLVLGIFVCILLKQQFITYSQIAPAEKLITKGKDFISQRDNAYNSARELLPTKGTYSYISDSASNPSEFLMFYYISQYAMAPRILTDSLHTDTIVGYFYKTGSINNPKNPLYATRTQWTILSDNRAGVMLLKKNR